MDKRLAAARIEQLKRAINKYRHNRLVLNKEEISPEAEDALKKELFDLEQQFPELITSDSPTQRVGGQPLKEFKKFKHEAPMLSLNDAFSESDMEDWVERLENYLESATGDRKKVSNFFCELKIDGLAIELTYENGLFIRGLTRGDGLIGEDITQNLKTVEAIPLKLIGNPPKHLVVRGEVFLSTKEFNRINKEQIKKGLKPFANPRNIAAGSVRQLDPTITASRKLDSFQYDIVTDLGIKNPKTHEERHEVLHSFGFRINEHNKPAKNLKEVFDFRDYWEKHREKLPYEIDGVVIIANNNEVFETAGVVGKAPRGAMAYKFSPREATTIIEDIKIQVGRTGALTPVAVLRPVEVGGVRIVHATLHNFDQIKKLGIKIGDTVVVSRAGDVIPQITKVIEEMRTGKEKAFAMPERCPIDGSKIIKEAVLFRCANPRCGARNKEFLRHFISRSAFDIRGMGPKIINRFLDEGLISDAADIFELEIGDIIVLERFGEKSAENLVKEIQSRKNIALSRFIYSLGILHIGEETANLLGKQFPVSGKSKDISVKDFIKFYQDLGEEELRKLPDIGPKVAESVYSWFHDEKSIHFLEKLDKVGIKLEVAAAKIISQKLGGKSFVLTGTLETMSREEAKERIRELGGDISESVSKKTDFVVVGAEPGSKYEKAKQLGVKVLDEEEFKALVK